LRERLYESSSHAEKKEGVRPTKEDAEEGAEKNHYLERWKPGYQGREMKEGEGRNG